MTTEPLVNIERSSGALPLQSFPLHLEHVRDIEAFDGPLLSEFRSGKGEIFLYLWCDCDEATNRWIVVRTPQQTLFRYSLARISLRDVINGSPDGFVYLVDLGLDGEMRQTWYVQTDRLPTQYLPSTESFYTHGEDAESGYQDIYVGGEGDDAIEVVSIYPKKYRQAYAFSALFGKQDRHARGQIPDYKLRGGYVYHNLFKKLAEGIPREIRADTVALQAASPGFIRFRVEDGIAEGVRDAVGNYLSAQETVREISKLLRRWLKDRRRLREPQVRQSIIELSGILELDGNEILRANEALDVVTKSLLSYSNRIKFLAEKHASEAAMMVGIQDTPRNT